MTATMKQVLSIYLQVLSLWLVACRAFMPGVVPLAFPRNTRRSHFSSGLHAGRPSSPPKSAPLLSPRQKERREIMLDRNGPYFSLDRMRGTVEFGSTANLVTQLDTQANTDTIERWLSDERRVALSIWDEKLIQDLGDSVFRLQIMTLQFVTIQLKPSVDVKMWTRSADGKQVFYLQSEAFEPNLQILPGIGLSAESLGINIEVVGEFRATADGKGVTGKIAFQSGGLLPPPMRLLPEPVLKTASDTINETVAQFAIQSFQRGATSKYREFRDSEQRKSL